MWELLGPVLASLGGDLVNKLFGGSQSYDQVSALTPSQEELLNRVLGDVGNIWSKLMRGKGVGPRVPSRFTKNYPQIQLGDVLPGLRKLTQKGPVTYGQARGAMSDFLEPATDLLRSAGAPITLPELDDAMLSALVDVPAQTAFSDALEKIRAATPQYFATPRIEQERVAAGDLSKAITGGRAQLGIAERQLQERAAEASRQGALGAGQAFGQLGQLPAQVAALIQQGIESQAKILGTLADQKYKLWQSKVQKFDFKFRAWAQRHPDVLDVLDKMDAFVFGHAQDTAVVPPSGSPFASTTDMLPMLLLGKSMGLFGGEGDTTLDNIMQLMQSFGGAEGGLVGAYGE